MESSPPGMGKEWSGAMRKARGRIRAWKASVRRCERARDEAVLMLEVYAERMAAMVERGEIGSRKIGEGEPYPQLRVVYWGEIESGSMSLLCLEVDYGAGERARVGVWGRLRALWESSALTPSERARAWARSMSMGSPKLSESVWLDIRACLRALSSDLELALDFGGADPLAPSLPAPGSDAGWDEWVARHQMEAAPLGLALLEQTLPTDEEWAVLEADAAELLSAFGRLPSAPGAASEAEEPKAPPSDAE